MRKYFAEFIGTFVLILIGCGTAVGANALFTALGMGLPVAFTTLTIAIAFGVAYMIMYYTFGSIYADRMDLYIKMYGINWIGGQNGYYR